MEEYEPIKVLGEGSFGKVYLMKHSKTRDLVCTKVSSDAALVGSVLRFTQSDCIARSPSGLQ